jgi:hypothetical protein
MKEAIALPLIRQLRDQEKRARRCGWSVIELYRGLGPVMEPGDRLLAISSDRVTVSRRGAPLALARWGLRAGAS